jgi:Skp family chaperone for outer membrane proteins
MLGATNYKKNNKEGCVNNMKNTIIAFIAMNFAALALTASAQGPAGRIVTVDLNKVFTDYYKTPIASAKIKDTAESFNKELNEMVDNYKKEIEDLNKLREDQDKPEYTAEVRDQKRKAVSEKLADTQKVQRDIDDYRTSHGKILQDQQLRMRQTILKEIQDVIDKNSRDAGYLLVLDKSGNTANAVPTILFSQDSLDITDDITKILNKNLPRSTETSKPVEKKDDKK